MTMCRMSLRFALVLAVLVGASCVGCRSRIALTTDSKIVEVSRCVMVEIEAPSKKDTSFVWKSSDPSVLKIVGGGLSASAWGMAPGTAKISVEGITTAAMGRITLTVVPATNVKDTPGGKLFYAAESGDQAAFERLLAEGVDVNFVNPHEANMPVLTAAVRARQRAMVDALLNAGADPNLKDDQGLTPLMHAASGGSRDIIEALLVRGKAKTDLKAKDGRSALDCAFGAGHRQAFSQLAEAGARKTKYDGAREWLKQDRRLANEARNARAVAFVWFVLFLVALRPPHVHELVARRRLYYKVISEDQLAYVETDRVNQMVRRRIQTFPALPPIHTRVLDGEVFEPSAETEPASALEFHEHWHWPYTPYRRWILYLRLCALTVLSVPMFLIWIIVAEDQYSRFPPFSWLPRGGDAIFFIAIAAAALPPLLFLISLVAFVRFQMAKPTARQQAVALVAGAVVLLGLAGLVWLVLAAMRSLGG